MFELRPNVEKKAPVLKGFIIYEGAQSGKKRRNLPPGSHFVAHHPQNEGERVVPVSNKAPVIKQGRLRE